MRSAYPPAPSTTAPSAAQPLKHLDGAAFDIAMSNHDPAAFEHGAGGRVPRLRLLPALGFIHVDLGPAQPVGRAFPGPGDGFLSGTPSAREVLAESRTMRVAARPVLLPRWARPGSRWLSRCWRRRQHRPAAGPVS